jgi:(1->4)-alpha-D-glucan 1-alpha-D-glucosylmutase
MVREDWPVAGTTGYELIGALAGLLVDSDREAESTEAYHRFIGARPDYNALVRSLKRRTLTRNLAGELRHLVRIAHTLASRHLATRDFGPDTLRSAIIALAAALPVYRTYVTASGGEAADVALLEAATRDAQETREVDDRQVLDFVKRMLLVDVMDAEDRAIAQHFATRFQQTSGALTAKAVEDTAFYRYNRFLALNEVGGEPDVFGEPMAAFHRTMLERHARQPLGLSSTATHDTKRGEDARARLYVLSEMPAVWAAAAERWREQNRALKRRVRGRTVPDAETEWAFYQALAGAWPPELTPDDAAGLAILAERMTQFALKAAREATLHTSWTAPDAGFEQAVEHFVRSALEPRTSPEFLADFARLLQPVSIAGALNSLTQTLIKLTAPGVPDIYQGTELWDFSMVDPDNRRPVDFDRIARLASELDGRGVPALLRNWRSDAVKLHLLRTGLRLRAQRPALFRDGAYLPLDVVGDHCRCVVAFARVLKEEAAVAIAPRLALGLLEGLDIPIVEASRWRNTAVILPPALANRRWLNLCTGEGLGAGTEVALDAILHISPVSLMLTDSRTGT